MNNGWLRFALMCEFLLALVAVFATWSQVGGQGHLDLMMWCWKLLLGAGLSLAITGMTAALMRSEGVFSRGMVLWGLTALVIAVAMGLATYYYHLHEVDDETDEDTTTARLSIAVEGRV
ncbi:MAG: hypothetical protein JSU00_14870 [Acidobacteria bacterium]|nr:hypothetical protein [Acidobacteriota bacterium]